MRILILNWRDPSHPWSGGAEGYLWQIARRWVAAGHRVDWLCGRHEKQAAHDAEGGVRIHRGGGTYGVYLAAACTYLRRFRGQVDVLIDGENGIPFWSPVYSRVPKIVLVHHVHRDVFHRELPGPLAHFATVLEGRLMPWLYRHDSFVAVSDSTRQELLQLGVSAERLAVVHNGVDHERLRPGLRAERPTVLSIGRLRGYKCVDTLLEAVRLWDQRRWEPRRFAPGQLDGGAEGEADERARRPGLRVLIAGEGPDRARLEARATALGVSARVEFVGFVDPGEKRRLLQSAHVVVQTSMKEGWGMTAMEAAACGTPVVASNVAGLRDSVRHGETGLLVPPQDPRALADAVAELLDDPARSRRYAQAATRWAERFRWQASAERWLELLHARRQGPTVPVALRHDRESSYHRPMDRAHTPKIRTAGRS